MQRLQGFARLPASGAPALDCTITVYETGTLTLATIYEDDEYGPTPKANPFQSSAVNGYWFFYASAGRYDIEFSGGDIPGGSEYVLADSPSGLGNGAIPSYETEGDLPSTTAEHKGRLALVSTDTPAFPVFFTWNQTAEDTVVAFAAEVGSLTVNSIDFDFGQGSGYQLDVGSPVNNDYGDGTFTVRMRVNADEGTFTSEADMTTDFASGQSGQSDPVAADDTGVLVDDGTDWLRVVDYPLSNAAIGDLAPHANLGRLRYVIDEHEGLYIEATEGWVPVLSHAFKSSAFAGLPAAGLTGRLRRLTDGPRGLWMDTGAGWAGLGGEVANVLEFGALRDGSDDTQAFQDAIDAVGFGSGGVVIVPPGGYGISAPLELRTGVVLRGMGQPGICQLTALGGFSGDCFIRAFRRDDNTLANEDQVTIENLGFVFASGTPDAFSAIDLTGACNSIVRNCQVWLARSSAEDDSMLRLADQNPTSSSAKHSQNNLITQFSGTASRFLTLAQAVDGRADNNAILGFEGIDLKTGLHFGGVVAGSARLLLMGGQLTAAGAGTLAYDQGSAIFPLKLQVIQVQFSGFDTTGDVADELLFSGAFALNPSGTTIATPLDSGSTLPQTFAGSVYVRLLSGTALNAGVNTFTITLPGLTSNATLQVIPVSGLPSTPVTFMATSLGATVTITVVAGSSVVLSGALVMRILRVGP